MKNVKAVLTAVTFVAAIGGAFASSKMRTQANVFTNSTGTCRLILCNTDPVAGTTPCAVGDQKYSVRLPNGQCDQPISTAFAVPTE
ncbi:hypothetical protein J2T02_002615 [Chitinophaga terrae (ex Kim and Jung 2007)]|uniref:DUF6520 family protein n=1 Tax=Chitinophaga terrae (ex Kim and Jung 2007) TaxID=408074 RepID=UPI002786D5CE|nr:DUF6520 family protein [Chitinophaga terrae (ex Kim and Jung 2007)]MDQ0107496.1 hypothetical protein [Chitinophaga terrae (ex Kim and Jung 2007)]